MENKPLKFKYVKIYGSEDGETHFEDVEMEMEYKDYAPPSPLIAVTPHMSATGTVAIGFPSGWFGGFHAAPKHQWMTFTAGKMEICVTDGEKRIFEAGTAVLQMDAGSKGHSTRIVGDDDCFMIVTEV